MPAPSASRNQGDGVLFPGGDADGVVGRRVGARVDEAVAPRGRAQLTHGEVVAALIANRRSAPTPPYHVAGWASSAAVHELLDVPAGLLGHDRLVPALGALAPS
jgi:hypothetical protein